MKPTSFYIYNKELYLITYTHVYKHHILYRYGVQYMSSKYKARYMKEHYKRPTIRVDIYRRLRELCGGRGINECLTELLSRLSTVQYIKPELRSDVCRFIDVAVRLANKHPEDPESDILYSIWDKVIGICQG